MSSGLDCYFEEKEIGKWYLYLEEEYGHKIDIGYDRYGPFGTFKEAEDYLRDNFANPGGYSVYAHKDSTDISWQFDN